MSAEHVFCLLSKNINIKIYKTTILPVDWYGCKTCSVIIREHRIKFLGTAAEENISNRGEGTNRRKEKIA
jgi:hypothetical protein